MQISADQLTVRVGGRTLLEGIDLSLEPGELVVVVGPNGAGKSTLLKALMGWLPSEGRVSVGDAAIGQLSGRERAARLGWLPQRAHVSESLPVVDVVAAARFRFGEAEAVRRHAAQRALASLGAEGFAARGWASLSGGEAQRVALAGLVAQEPRWWLLDEPANHLDPAVQHELYGQIVGAWRSGIGVMLVTHDINLMLSAVSLEEQARATVVGLDRGRMVWQRSLSDPGLGDALGQLYRVKVTEVEVDGYRHLVFGGPQ